MFATPAIGWDGQDVLLATTCQGDGHPDHTCGLRLRFSHDEINGDTVHRYGSCTAGHSWFMTGNTANTLPIEVRTSGELTDDTDPNKPGVSYPTRIDLMHGSDVDYARLQSIFGTAPALGSTDWLVSDQRPPR